MNNRQRAAHPTRVQVSGSLAPYTEGFRQDPAAKGYHPQVIGRKARLMADLSAWLQDRSSDALTAEVINDYLRARHVAGCRDLVSVRALAPLLAYLRGMGATPPAAAPVPRTAAEALLAEFSGYLTRERGLSPASVTSYLRHARPFLDGLQAPSSRTWYVERSVAALSACQNSQFD
jgi:hypothetical protein